MAEKSHLIREVFQTIENNDNGQILWNLLEQTNSDNGIVYMTYGSETPETLAQKYHRQNLLKLIKLHQKIIVSSITFLNILFAFLYIYLIHLLQKININICTV